VIVIHGIDLVVGELSIPHWIIVSRACEVAMTRAGR
jgi:hypothetical protein